MLQPYTNKHAGRVRSPATRLFDIRSTPDIGLLRLKGKKSVQQQIKVEIRGKDEFWGRAFHVEWEHQFPNRKLLSDGAGCFLTRTEWLDDLERVGSQTFCTILRTPENPRRREWMGSLIPRRSS